MSLNLSNKNLGDNTYVLRRIMSPEKYKFVNLSSNNLLTIPKDLLRFTNIIKLDISRNDLKNIQEVSTILAQFPSLRMLNIDLYSQEEAGIILKHLPNLTQLNGETTFDENEFEDEGNDAEGGNDNNQSEDDEETSLFSEKEVFTNICAQIKEMRGCRPDFDRDFQKKLKIEIENINEKIDLPDYLYKMNIAKSKIEIFNFLRDEMFNILIKGKDDNEQKSALCIAEKIIKAKIEKNQHILYEIISQLHFERNSIKNNNDMLLEEERKPFSLDQNPIPQKKEKKEKTDNNTTSNNNNSTNNIINNTPTLSISKKVLLSTLKEIYNYHKETNKNNFQNRIPEKNFKFSIESFLVKKYGVKSIVDNYLNQIYISIEKFSNEESEINLFKKILTNKIDENSYETYNELKEICESVLLNYIKEMNPYAPVNEIEKKISQKKRNFISEDEWRHILSIIFSNDYNVIFSQIIEFINIKNENDERYIEANSNLYLESRMTREEKRNYNFKMDQKIRYDDFIRILLDFQIKLREKYLSKYSNAFNEIDTDGDGVINENEFRNILGQFDIDIKGEDVDKLLDMIDPFEFGDVSFNKSVKAMSELVIGGKGGMSALDTVITSKPKN